MKELINKTIKRVLIDKYDTILAFDTDEGVIAYETYGDCCSSTWIESITGVEELLGNTVLTSETVSMPTPDNREYKNGHCCDELQDYGIKLTTAKGYIDIVYRNSSNGYYGGSLDLMINPPDLLDYRDITDDWVAC